VDKRVQQNRRKNSQNTRSKTISNSNQLNLKPFYSPTQILASPLLGN